MVTEQNVAWTPEQLLWYLLAQAMLTEAASDALTWLAQTFVESEFPELHERTYKLPSEHAAAAQELVVRGFVKPAPRGYVQLTKLGQAWIMTHRPDLDADTWSTEADNFRDVMSAKYQDCGSLSGLGELTKRLRGELRALGFIERTTQHGGWQLTSEGQAWIFDNAA